MIQHWSFLTWSLRILEATYGLKVAVKKEKREIQSSIVLFTSSLCFIQFFRISKSNNYEITNFYYY